jgi:glycine cleavage system pyridoxal-binding protein P
MRYLPLTPTDRGAMLSRIGVNTIDDLFIDTIILSDALQAEALHQVCKPR